MDSNRNQPRITHHQGSQQLADLFFVFITGGGLGHGEDGDERKSNLSYFYFAHIYLYLCVGLSADQETKWLLRTISAL